MKNTIILLLGILFLVSCNKSTSIKKERQLFFNSNEIGYSNQKPFIHCETNDTETIATFGVDKKIGEALQNDKVDYTFFDNLYRNDLSNCLKQNLAFIILSKKDLIKIASSNINDKNIVEKLNLYTGILIENKYIGYSILYNSLKTISQYNPKLYEELLKKIIRYSREDKLTQIYLENKGNFLKEEIYQKVKQNNDALLLIRKMTEIK